MMSTCKPFLEKGNKSSHSILNAKQKNLLVILLLLLLCLILRLVNYIGVGINDDIAYIQNARSLAQGYNPISSGFNQLGFRLGMVAPLSLFYKLFGFNNIAFSSYPLICSLITCALIYLTAVRLWGRSAAIFASLLWIAYPLQIVFDTQLSPSNQQATCVVAALFFYFYSIKDRTSAKFDFLSKSREPVLLILSGIFLGFGWWLNELFVTFILVVLPFLLLVRPKIKHLLWVIAGFLIIIFLELLIVKISTGSWLARFYCILKTEAAVVSNKNPEYLPRTLFKVFNANPLYDEGHFGIIWYLFVIVSTSALLLKQKLILALALGCWLWLGYLQWGVQSFNLTPITKYIRYISMVVPIQCLAFGAILGHFLKFSKKLNIFIIFLFILLLIHLSWLGTKAVNTVKIHTEDFREIAGFFSNLELQHDDIIYTDDLTANFVEIYSKGNLSIQRLNNFQVLNPPKKGFLVAYGSRYIIEQPGYRRALPEWFLYPPPAHWPLLYTIRGKQVGVYQVFDPKIYKILPK